MLLTAGCHSAEKKTKKSSKSKSKKEHEENKDSNELATGAASVKPVTDKETKPLVKHLVEEPKTNDTPVPQPKIETEVKKLETHVLPLYPPPAEKEKHPSTLQGETHVLPLTPPPAAEKAQPAAAPVKKAYPQEKRPKTPQGPSFGQRLMAAAPKDKPQAKPEEKEKDKEHKRSDARPEIPKPVETAAQRKAPERPLQQTRQKPKEKVYQSNSHNHTAELLPCNYYFVLFFQIPTKPPPKVL